MWKLVVWVKRATALSVAEFGRTWTERLVPKIQAALDQQESVRRLVLCLPPAALSNKVRAAFPPQFDGMLAIWFDSADEAKSAMSALAVDASLQALAAEVVSPSEGVAFLAKAVPPVLNGKSNVTLLVSGQVAKDMTLEEAQAYYVNVHPRVAQSVPDFWKFLVRYAQFCGDPTKTADVGWLAQTRRQPMASEIGLANADDIIAMHTHPAYATTIGPDERKFFDASETLGYMSGPELVLLDRMHG